MCPFCKSENIEITSAGNGYSQARCLDCRSRGPRSDDDSEVIDLLTGKSSKSKKKKSEKADEVEKKEVEYAAESESSS